MIHGLPGYPECESADDPVLRLRRYRASHPDVIITPPSDATGGFWVATRDGERIAYKAELAYFMDELDEREDGQ